MCQHCSFCSRCDPVLRSCAQSLWSKPSYNCSRSGASRWEHSFSVLECSRLCGIFVIALQWRCKVYFAPKLCEDVAY